MCASGLGEPESIDYIIWIIIAYTEVNYDIDAARSALQVRSVIVYVLKVCLFGKEILVGRLLKIIIMIIVNRYATTAKR